MIQPTYAPSRSWFMAVSGLAFLIIAAFSVFLAIKTSSLESGIADLKAKKGNLLEMASGTSTPSELANVVTAATVKANLAQIEQKQLVWSKIVEKIETTIPKLKDTNEPIVSFRSYNGSEDGKIAVSAATRASAFDPFSDIALTISAFVNEPAFKGVFVPSITKTLTPDNGIVLSFSITFDYQKQNF